MSTDKTPYGPRFKGNQLAVVKTQSSWAASAEVASMKPSYPAVSVVKGVTYTLVDFTE